MEKIWTIGEFPERVSVAESYGQPVFTIRVEIEETEDGWRWLEAVLPVHIWERGNIISTIVRMCYTADEVEAILNNVLNDPLDEARMAEYKALQEWRKKAKSHATELMEWAEEHGIGNVSYVPTEGANEPTGVESKPDGILQLAQALSLMKSQAQELPDERAAEVPALFPAWENFIGEWVEVGKRMFYAGRLWKVLQAHTVQADWTPDVVPALFTEVVVQGEDEPEIGTLDNPIPYNGNMALDQGKYYSQGGVTYLCIRDTGNPVYNDLSDLVGLYVQVV